MSVTALRQSVNQQPAYPIVKANHVVPMAVEGCAEHVKTPRFAKLENAFSVSLNAVVWSAAMMAVVVRAATVDLARSARAGAASQMVLRPAPPTHAKTEASAPRTPPGFQSANAPRTSLATIAKRRWLSRTAMST